MNLNDKVVVVTGAGSGIGAALCARFAQENARSVTVLDINAENAQATAAALAERYPNIAAHSAGVDVSSEDQLVAALDEVIERDGTVDLYVGNVGIATGMGVEASNDAWRQIIDVNVMSHIYAARKLIPAWLARGEGHMLITASAAGLLTNLGDAPYSVSKHGAVALAEWLSVTYGHRGVHMYCLCPQGVRTPLLFPEGADDVLAQSVVKSQRIIEPEDVADSVIEALSEERFLILPHEEVHDYEVARATDRQRWLGAMRRMQVHLDPPASSADGPTGTASTPAHHRTD